MPTYQKKKMCARFIAFRGLNTLKSSRAIYRVMWPWRTDVSRGVLVFIIRELLSVKTSLSAHVLFVFTCKSWRKNSLPLVCAVADVTCWPHSGCFYSAEVCSVSSAMSCNYWKVTVNCAENFACVFLRHLERIWKSLNLRYSLPAGEGFKNQGASDSCPLCALDKAVARAGYTCTTLNGREPVNDEVGGVWKETVIPNFKVLQRNLFGWIERNCRKVSGNGRPIGRKSNSGCPEY
jgi:hypothetical protein